MGKPLTQDMGLLTAPTPSPSISRTTSRASGRSAHSGSVLPVTVQDAHLQVNRAGRQSQDGRSSYRQSVLSLSVSVSRDNDNNEAPAASGTPGPDTCVSPLSHDGTLYGEKCFTQFGLSPEEAELAQQVQEMQPWPLVPENCMRWEQPPGVSARDGTIPPGPIYSSCPSRPYPSGWTTHVHLEGKRFFERRANNFQPGSSTDWPDSLTILTDSDPRDPVTLAKLNHIHNEVVQNLRTNGVHRPSRTELCIEFYPDPNHDWHDFGGYYLVDFDTQTVFWAEETSAQLFGKSRILNMGEHDEQHLKSWLHRQFWVHVECYPLVGSIDIETEEASIVEQITFSILDVLTSESSISNYNADKLESFLSAIEKTPKARRTWVIARIANLFAEQKTLHYAGHPSARLSRFHSVDQNDTPKEAKLEGSSTVHTAQSMASTLIASFYFALHTLIAVLLRICCLALFDAPASHNMELERMTIDGVVYGIRYEDFVGGLINDWQDTSLLSTVLFTANMAFLAIPSLQAGDVSAASVGVSGMIMGICSLLSTIFSIGSIAIGLINVRKHRHKYTAFQASQILTGLKHHVYGFRPLAILFAMPYAFLLWSVFAFSAAVATFCAAAPGVTQGVSFSFLGIVLGAILLTVRRFWRRETSWRAKLHEGESDSDHGWGLLWGIRIRHYLEYD